jgi:hypothetical protein
MLNLSCGTSAVKCPVKDKSANHPLTVVARMGAKSRACENL